ncbi:MAG: helix-turn-helix domain-containing protein [Phenylobacterium sp.]
MTEAAYQISPAQLEALTAPVRHDILDRLIAKGPMAVAEIAAALGRERTAIYHHLRQLEAVGLVEAMAPSPPSSEPGRPSLRYKAVARVLVATVASQDPANRPLVARLVRAAADQAARDFEKGLASPARTSEGPARNHTFFRAVIAPSPERLARINALLRELEAVALETDPEPGPLVSIAWIAAPLAKPRRRGSKVIAGVAPGQPFC